MILDFQMKFDYLNSTLDRYLMNSLNLESDKDNPPKYTSLISFYVQKIVCAFVILARLSCVSRNKLVLNFLTFERICFGFQSLFFWGGGFKSPPLSLKQKALESGSLSERLENLRVLGFRGPKPRKTCWAGSVYRGFPTVEGSMYKQVENSNHLKM